MSRVDPVLFGLGIGSIVGGKLLIGYSHYLINGWVIFGIGIFSVVASILVRRKR